MTTAALPGLREQIEQLVALAEQMSAERDRRMGGIFTDEARAKIASSSARLGQARSLEVRERYLALLRKLGPSTCRRISENLGISQSAVKTRMVELRKLGLVRDLGSEKLRIYEVV